MGRRLGDGARIFEFARANQNETGSQWSRSFRVWQFGVRVVSPALQIPDTIDRRAAGAAGLSIGGREGTAARVTIDGESGRESERGMDPPVVRPRQTGLTGSGLHLGKGWGRRGR